MSDKRVERVLDATYACLVRHGVRKTTMDDIAAAAGMSRPAVYQYVRNKEDAFQRAVARLYEGALAKAEKVAAGEGTLTQKLDRALGVKLMLSQQLLRDSPYPNELAQVCADLEEEFTHDMTALITATIGDAAADADLQLGDGNAREVAELTLALTRGLEADPVAERARERLRNGVALLVAGLAAAAQVPGRRP